MVWLASPKQIRKQVCKPTHKAPLKEIRREWCARCGQPISCGATPCVWHEYIVCGRCHSKLRALEPAMALSKSVCPDLPYAHKPAVPSAPRHPGQILGWCYAAMKKPLHL
jgi:hypothetical protein